MVPHHICAQNVEPSKVIHADITYFGTIGSVPAVTRWISDGFHQFVRDVVDGLIGVIVVWTRAVVTGEAALVGDGRVEHVRVRPAMICTVPTARTFRLRVVHTNVCLAFGKNEEEVVDAGMPAIHMLRVRDLALDVSVQYYRVGIGPRVCPHTGQDGIGR